MLRVILVTGTFTAKLQGEWCMLNVFDSYILKFMVLRMYDVIDVNNSVTIYTNNCIWYWHVDIEYIFLPNVDFQTILEGKCTVENTIIF